MYYGNCIILRGGLAKVISNFPKFLKCTILGGHGVNGVLQIADGLLAALREPRGVEGAEAGAGENQFRV